MAAVREQSALYRVSFVCVHRVLREVCVRFRYLLPFPLLSHRFDHEIREDRATQEVNPFHHLVSAAFGCHGFLIDLVFSP